MDKKKNIQSVHRILALFDDQKSYIKKNVRNVVKKKVHYTSISSL